MRSVIYFLTFQLVCAQPLTAQTDANAPPLKTTDSSITDTDRSFWSFRPLQVAEPTANTPCRRTAVDGFILDKLNENGLQPNPSSDRRTLIRRAYFDLLGLPPTPEQVDAFITNSHPKAWEKLIDDLLRSDHYGERWARHWMDVARFAESSGFEHDSNRPFAYHYRDFLIRALNDDMPYDQFVRWQLAGDELAPDDPLAMRATGFLGAGVFPTQFDITQDFLKRQTAIHLKSGSDRAADVALADFCQAMFSMNEFIYVD